MTAREFRWVLLAIVTPLAIASAVGFAFKAGIIDVIDHPAGPLQTVKLAFSLLFSFDAKDTDSWKPMLDALAVLDSQQRAAPYETVFFGQGVKFQYPLTSLLPLEIFRWCGVLNISFLNALNSLVFVINIIAATALAGLVAARNSALPNARAAPGDWRWMAAAGLVTSLLFYPTAEAVNLGQIQMWIDLLFTFACLSWWLERKLLVGLLIGFAAAIKPQLGMFLIWGVLWREWSFSAGFLIAILPLAGFSAALYGWHNNLAYLDVLSFISAHGEVYYTNSSINGFMNWLLLNGNPNKWTENSFAPYHPYVFAATTATFVIFMALALLPPIMWRNRRPNIFDFGSAALIFTVASPIVWMFHYGIMLPLYIIVLSSLLNEEGAHKKLKLVALFISWSLAANYFGFLNLLGDSRWNALQLYRFAGAVILLGLMIENSAVFKDSLAVWQSRLSLRPQR